MSRKFSQTDLRLVVAGPVRWGYELVVPAEPSMSPERNFPPQLRPPRMVPRTHAAGLGLASAIAGAGAVAIIILDGALGVFAPGGARGSNSTLVLVFNAIAAVVAFYAARVWQESRRSPSPGHTQTALEKYWLPTLNAIIAFVGPYFVLTVEALAGVWQIMRGQQDLVPDPADLKRVEAEHGEAVAAWQQRVMQFEASDRARYDSADLWYPVVPSHTVDMVSLFGGNPISWAAALCTSLGTMVGAGFSILIGDLSRRRTSDQLVDLCRNVGVDVRESVLPVDLDSADLFAEMSWRDLANLLVEVLHSAVQDVDTSRRERGEDRAVILEIAEKLDADGPVTISRLRKAMLVVEGASLGGNDAVIAADEYDRLAAMYNDVQRQHGGVLERVTRLERALRDFEVLDPASSRSSASMGTDGAGVTALDPSPKPHGQSGSLRIIGVDKRAADLDSDRFVDLLFQLLLRQTRTATTQYDVLVILGADRIRRGGLESLLTFAQHEHVKVMLFFEHLRDEAVNIIGAGGAAAGFFALGNAREAKEAADFIGGDYKWVESSYTRSRGNSLTKTWGQEESVSDSVSRGLPSGLSRGQTVTRGRSFSAAFGTSSEDSLGEQRVREALVEAEVIQGLPVTGMIYAEVLPGGRRIVRNVDCDPLIRFAERVSTEPLSDEAMTSSGVAEPPHSVARPGGAPR